MRDTRKMYALCIRRGVLSSRTVSSSIDAPESTTNYLSSGFVKDGAGRHQTSEGGKNVASSFSLRLRILSRFCGRIVFVSKCLLETRAQILEHGGYDHEDQNVTWDRFFSLPKLSCGVMHLLRIAHCALVPRIVCPSVKSSWILQ